MPTVESLSFIELLILILLVGSMAILVIFKIKIGIKWGNKSLNTENKNNGRRTDILSFDADSGIAPHTVCSHRFDFIDIHGRIEYYQEEIHKILYKEIPNKQSLVIKQKMQTYSLEVLCAYRLALENIMPDDRYAVQKDYQFFKLLFYVANLKTSVIFSGIITTNGFSRFKNNPQLQIDFKEDIYLRIKTSWSGILDEYYHDKLLIPREAINGFNVPIDKLKIVVDEIIEKLIEITLTSENKIKDIRKEMQNYIIGTFDIDILLDRNGNINRARNKNAILPE